jgi:hypothetical protein
MKRTFAAAAFLCLAGSAAAETGLDLAPVDTLTCEQMQAEMTIAGQAMSQNMDPNMAANIERMRDDAGNNMAETGAGIVGTGLLCSVPGLGVACMAATSALAARQEKQAAEAHKQTDAVVGSMNQATAGLDIERLMAVAGRWESEGCTAPPEARDAQE